MAPLSGVGSDLPSRHKGAGAKPQGRDQMNMTQANLRPTDFVGQWQVHRQIADRISGQDSVFQGICTFYAMERDRLDYVEAGKIRIGGGPQMTANRRYQWHFEADRVDVRFGGGAAFHQFVPAGRVQGSDHPCGDDHYRVHYDFVGWPVWQAVWTVTGPRKDYTSTSIFTR